MRSAGAVAIQLPASQGQCAILERAHHCSLRSHPVHHRVFAQLWRASRLEVHNAILGGLSCVIFTALVTNLVKLAVRATVLQS